LGAALLEAFAVLHAATAITVKASATIKRVPTLPFTLRTMLQRAQQKQ
jgi:hypothetical protein